MTVTELAKRVETLEKEMEYLKSQVSKNGTVEAPNSSTGHKGLHWWHEGQGAGRFADDPEFEEMCRLGREYRESLGPKPRKKKKTARKK